jgi:DNA repair protein RecO (recombination protein O)
MPVHELEAIILRQYALSDADRVIVALSREQGKVRAAARGIKKPRSPLAGCLEPSNHVRLELWVREGRDLGRVRGAELIHSFLGRTPDYGRMCVFSYFAELVGELVPEGQSSPAMFRLLLACQHAAEARPSSRALVRYFEVWGLKLGGLLPNYAYCSGCGKCVKDAGFFAWIEAGQARCAACAGGRGMRVGPAAAAALGEMMGTPPEKFAASTFPRGALEDLERLFRKLLELHLDRQLKSYRIMCEAVQEE